MSNNPKLNVITGAFSFTGRHIAVKLLERGERVVTLTNHPDPNDPIADKVRVLPLKFDDPDGLRESLKGASVLYNTYWIRFAHGSLTFDQAVQNSFALIKAAAEAGVSRMVHVSITNPSADSPLPYFKGKALIEKKIMESGMSYAILRPTVVYGDKGILLNTIAWILRRSPFFPVPGDGCYKLQPVLVDDLADLAVQMADSSENTVVDAVGPETYTFNELLELVRSAVGSRSALIHVNPRLAQVLSVLPGILLRDVVLTREEVVGLMDNLLISSQPPTCPTRLSDWVKTNADSLGRKYISELEKHYR